MTNERPLVLGHRGASALAPENTLAAFKLAQKLGADGVELDVTLTRDKIPVIIHDDTVDRTTNGHGAVRNLTILDIQQFDAGSFKGPEFRGERIPTLAEVLDGLEDWLNPVNPQRSRPGLLNIEIKSTGLTTDGVEREVVNLVVRHNLEKHVIISSFNPLALFRVRNLNPSVLRGLLYSPDLPVFLRRAWFRYLAAPHALHPEHVMIDEPYMRWAKRKRRGVNTWTVDNPAEAARLDMLGVNAIITNQPDVILHSLESPAMP